jgi:hypothetical protein
MDSSVQAETIGSERDVAIGGMGMVDCIRRRPFAFQMIVVETASELSGASRKSRVHTMWLVGRLGDEAGKLWLVRGSCG